MKKVLKAKYDCRGMDNDEIIETILEDRKIEDIQEFLHPDENSLIPFEKLKNIDKAYESIDDGIAMGYEFCVIWDEDQDGHAAGAIMTKYLQRAGAKVSYFVHDKKEHGVQNIDLEVFDGVDIIIVVDSLNNDPNVYKRITDSGISLIVMDHHIPSTELLNSDVPFVLVSSAVDYPNSQLSGAGVVLKCCLYCDEMNLTDYADDLWWYGAVGIVADVCSLAEPENRYIVNKGLSQYQNPIVKKMVGTYQFNTEAIQFSIAPLVNAAIRTRHNDLSAQMFLAEGEDEIAEIYPKLKACREEQNEIVNGMLPDLMKQGEEQLDKKFMVFFIDEADADITGLVGNRLLSEFQRPLVVVRDYDGVIAGSMRAIGVPDFMGMVNNTGLARCDGHESAAGFTCDKDKFEQFRNVIEDELADVEFSVDVEADIEITSEQVNEQLIKQLNDFNRISGKGCPAITVLIRTDSYEVSTFSTKKHLKIIDDSGVILVKWNDMSWKTMDNDGEFVGVGTLAAPIYGRQKYYQLTMNDYIKLDKSEEL